MRDPKRIPRILKLLEKIWLDNPDLRLAQLIVNCRPTVAETCPDLYYLEDDDLITRFEEVYKKEIENLSLKCFKCDKEIFDDTDFLDGTWFDASGNYGSAVFDPIADKGDVTLQIGICDDCMKAHKDKVLRSEYVRGAVWSQERFEPRDENA